MCILMDMVSYEILLMITLKCYKIKYIDADKVYMYKVLKTAGITT